MKANNKADQMDFIGALVDSCKPIKKRGRPSHKRQLQDIRLEKRINLQTSDSVVTIINLKSILSMEALQSLPVHCQNRLVMLLPEFDQIKTRIRTTNKRKDDNDESGQQMNDDDGTASILLKPSQTALNNEYFARFCTQYVEKLSDNKLSEKAVEQARVDTSKELARLDPWKLKNYEPIWGKKLVSQTVDGDHEDGMLDTIVKEMSNKKSISRGGYQKKCKIKQR